jgi:hypothetical protein
MPDTPVPYTQDQLDALRRMVCNETFMVAAVDQNLFAPLEPLYGTVTAYKQDDLMWGESLLSGYLDHKAALPQQPNALALAGEAFDMLSELVDGAGAFAPADKPLGTAASVISSVLGLASSGFSIGSEFNRGDTTKETTSHVELTTADLAGWIVTTAEEQQANLDELERLLLSDPSKLAATYGLAQDNGHWDLKDNAYGQKLAVQVQALLAAQRYMIPLLIGSASKYSCDMYTPPAPFPFPKPKNAMHYMAQVNLGQGIWEKVEPQVHWHYPYVAQLSSADLTSGDATTLAGRIFSDGLANVSAGTTFTNTAGGSLVRSDFFLKDIVPANNAKCGYTKTSLDPF